MKRLVCISCPATSRSGYGDHARDIIRSFIKIKDFEVSILDQRWGECPRNALTENDLDISSRINPTGQLSSQPDIWVQITVPNEFQPVGKYNIGITAGMETTQVAPQWIEGMNRMNMNIVPSNHAKKVFESTVYDRMNQQTKKKEGELRIQKPIEVLFEGSDLNVWKKVKDIPSTINETINSIKEDFCFLFVGHWLKGDFGHDRKDIGKTIQTFVETFKNTGKAKRPALIIKTSGAGFSVSDKYECLSKMRTIIDQLKQDVSIYLLHGDLTQEELNGLYNHKKVKAMISLTHGEGYGRPLQEFSITGKPVIASNWSGHVDFLSKHGIMVAGKLDKVHPSATQKDMILAEASWFYADHNYASAAMKSVFKEYKKHLEKTRKQTQYVKDNFSLEAMDIKLQEIMERHMSDVPKQVELKMPSLGMGKKMEKRFEKFGVASKHYVNAKEAFMETYSTDQCDVDKGEIYSTNLTFPDNPYNDDVKKAKVIFEIGFGVGRNLKWIMENTDADFYGVEPNKTMLEHFWTINDTKYKNRVHLFENFDDIPKDVKFDVVLSTYVFQHIGYMPPTDVQNISDITNSIMEYTEKDTVWLLIEHDGEDDWIQRWFDTHDIKPQVYKRSYTEQEKWTHRDSTVGNGQGHHLIIWKQ